MIQINIDKAKQIAHAKRRIARSMEFEPLDNLIAKQIPGQSFEQVEQQRQLVREKYAELQEKIDAETTVEGLKSLLPNLG